jgi:hypothetical protein
MSETDSPKESRPGRLGDGPMRAALLGVVCTAGVLVAGTYASYGQRAAIGVATGGGLAAGNLWVFQQIGEAFLGGRGRTGAWGAIGAVKLVALLGAVWLILRSGYVSGLALAVGYAALPVGITLGSLFGPKPPDDEGARRSFEDAPREDVLKARPPEAGEPPPSER